MNQTQSFQKRCSYGPMAGDRVVPAEVKFKKHVSILPTVEIKYGNLFEYPNGSPDNYKFTEVGKLFY